MFFICLKNYFQWSFLKVWNEMKCYLLSHCQCFAAPSGFSAHGIFQAKILEWVVISFSRGYSWSRDRTWGSCIAGRLFIIWASREALILFDVRAIFKFIFKTDFCSKVFFTSCEILVWWYPFCSYYFYSCLVVSYIPCCIFMVMYLFSECFYDFLLCWLPVICLW